MLCVIPADDAGLVVTPLPGLCGQVLQAVHQVSPHASHRQHAQSIPLYDARDQVSQFLHWSSYPINFLNHYNYADIY